MLPAYSGTHSQGLEVPQKRFIFFFLFFFFFRATLLGYENSQASGKMGAAAGSHSHSHTRSKPRLGPTLQLTAMLDPNSLCKARDQTHVLMDTSQVCYS